MSNGDLTLLTFLLLAVDFSILPTSWDERKVIKVSPDTSSSTTYSVIISKDGEATEVKDVYGQPLEGTPLTCQFSTGVKPSFGHMMCGRVVNALA